MNRHICSEIVLKLAKNKIEKDRKETEKRILKRIIWERKFDWR